MDNPIYLGDAVYAYFDGNGIELRLNRHDAPCAVYLEPEVLSSLLEFIDCLRALYPQSKPPSGAAGSPYT